MKKKRLCRQGLFFCAFAGRFVDRSDVSKAGVSAIAGKLPNGFGKQEE
jgi:hypothetical protein